MIKNKYVQLKNPRTKRWVKIDVETGNIVSHKKSDGPYKGYRTKEEKDMENLMKYGYSKEEIENMDDDEFVYTNVMLVDGMSKDEIDKILGK